MSITIKVTCTGAPVQIEGDVDGYPFYFRSRHDAWQFSVVKPGQHPIDDRGAVFNCIGDHSNASWMDPVAAENLVKALCEAFIIVKGSNGY